MYINSESSLVVEVKSIQYIDPLLMELKKLVLSMINESFSQKGIVSIGIKVNCVY